MVARKLFILLSLLLLATGAQAQTQPTRFLLTFVPNIQFAPVYVALEAGYFDEAGFDITVEYLNEPDVVDLVANDQAAFGIVSGEQVILAGAQGRPVQYVYTWFQRYPIGIVSAAGALPSLQDIAGRSVGLPGRFGASYSGLTAILAANDLAESDVELQEIGFNAPEVFCLGAVDAVVVYANNEPLQIESLISQGDCGDVSAIEVVEVGDFVSLVSNGLVTSQARAAANPEDVTAFVAAFDRALRDTISNPAQAYLDSLPHVPNLTISDDLRAALQTLAEQQAAFLASEPSREEISISRQQQRDALGEDFTDADLLQFDVLLNTIDMWDAETLGSTTDASWQNMADVLTTLGALAEPADISDLYTNAFVPAAGAE